MRRSTSARMAASTVIAAAIAVTATACATGADGEPASADPARIAESASSLGIAPELVFTTAVDGYDLAPQSVGPSNSDGMSATWFNSSTAGMLTIRTDRGEFTPQTCAATPLEEAADAAVTCTEKNGVWHRSAGDAHEYVAVQDGSFVRVSGVDAPRADLLAAAQAVHVPSAAELELLFSDAPMRPTAPVERGDLPENGDGAPIDPTGPGG
ncbi:hypothetical protein [Microbacterium sp. NPDC056569]|uniref:hypothetical protein n=1 Tax=Microbacterium sp. NPDC056569 TaxID=3345867 RepID=UPI00367063A5